MSGTSPATDLMKQMRLPPDWTEVNVAVALSGGADSVALLRGLSQLHSQSNSAGRLIAVHVNHQLRGEESDEDARWCVETCHRLEIPIEVLLAETSQFAASTGLGLEAAARQQRYELLRQAAEQAGVRYLTTAHTADDQVETILFRAVRGTGLRGLAGIPWTRNLTPALTLVRPLLDCTRELLEEFLAQLGQDFRTDSSNADRQFTRNRLRHDLLPMLRADFNAEVDSALLRLAEQASEAQTIIEQLAEGLLAQAHCQFEARQFTMQSSPFIGQHQIVVSEALRLVWRQAGLAEQAMNYQWWCQLASMLLEPERASSLNLPGDVYASIQGDALVLRW